MDKTYKRTKYDSIQHCPTCGRNFNVGYGLKSSFEMIDVNGKQTRFYNKTCRHCGCEFRFYWDKILKKNVFFVYKEGKIKEDTKMNLRVNRRVTMDILERQFIKNICFHFDAMLDELLSKVDMKYRCLNDRNTKIIVGKPIYALLINKVNKETIHGTRLECSIDTFLGKNRYWYKGIPIEESLGGTYNFNVATITIEFSDGYIPYELMAHSNFFDSPAFSRKKVTVEIKEVIFNNPATIVIWKDGTKTVVKRQKGDRYDKEKGLAMAFVKRTIGLKEFYKHLKED